MDEIRDALTENFHRRGVKAARGDRRRPESQPGPLGGVSRIVDDALTVDPELRAKRLTQAHRFGGEHVGVEASLDAGKYGGLKALCELFRPGEDDSTPGGPRRVFVVVQVMMSVCGRGDGLRQ